MALKFRFIYNKIYKKMMRILDSENRRRNPVPTSNTDPN